MSSMSTQPEDQRSQPRLARRQTVSCITTGLARLVLSTNKFKLVPLEGFEPSSYRLRAGDNNHYTIEANKLARAVYRLDLHRRAARTRSELYSG